MRLSNPKRTAVTRQMIDDLPVVDIHVHVPGTVSPATAWELGVRNKFITVGNRSGKGWRHGPKSLHPNDPHEHYADIFHPGDKGITLDAAGKPLNLRYAIEQGNFKHFDRVMATVQGHRHPPGGIQTVEDYRLVLHHYLQSCIRQNVFHTELQQNIRIAYQLYPDLPEARAREQFYLLAKEIQDDFAHHGVHVGFLHCFNKTGMAGDGKTPRQRALDGADWLMEARLAVPGVFVGLESAGHEKDETGWPSELKAGYDKAANVRKLPGVPTFGCEAHGGEGIGVEHMMDVIGTLPVSRLAHGFQVIEDEAAIAEVKRRGVILVMSPPVNLALGSPVHKKDNGAGKKIPAPKSKGGEPEPIAHLRDHPIFPLMREHALPIALATDNPEMGGVNYKTMLMQLCGLSDEHRFTQEVPPMSGEELARSCLQAIQAAFCEINVKRDYLEKLSSWMKKYDIEVALPVLT